MNTLLNEFRRPAIEAGPIRATLGALVVIASLAGANAFYTAVTAANLAATQEVGQ